MPYNRLFFLEQRGIVPITIPALDSPGALAIDEPQIRIDFFALEIAQVQAQLAEIEEERISLLKAIETVQKFFALEAAPIQEEIYRLEVSLHDLFAAAQAIPKGVKSRRRIGKVYKNLHGVLLRPLVPNPAVMPDNEPSTSTDDPASDYQYIPIRAAEAPRLDDRSHLQLRKVYLELCSLFHPDKHLGSAIHAAIMTEINIAYDNCDLNRLLQIKTQQAALDFATADPIEEYRAISAQFHAAFQVVLSLRQQEEVNIMIGIATGRGNPLKGLIATLTSQLEDLGRFESLLNLFLGGKIGILKFLDELESIEVEFDHELMD